MKTQFELREIANRTCPSLLALQASDGFQKLSASGKLKRPVVSLADWESSLAGIGAMASAGHHQSTSSIRPYGTNKASIILSVGSNLTCSLLRAVRRPVRGARTTSWPSWGPPFALATVLADFTGFPWYGCPGGCADKCTDRYF